ncbi:MAG: Asp-tRNA(Asn)/Glu-tRNA(Gln) amidotransferase subunit GatC [Phycisphaerales bacterium]|nr:Asp-tRNA(Asn)/Glu-tRNA(Gln) amidotransferase subunit GatC [Phycisphaerales bacterium]
MSRDHTSPPAASPAAAAPALSEQDVRHIARLARLAPSDDEVARYRTDLAAILSYVDRLRAVDLAGVEPMATPLEMTGPMERDEPRDGLARQALLGMAPAIDDVYIKVPKVLGGEGAGGA